MNDKKKNLLKLFSENTEYYFHVLEQKELGHLVYVTEEKHEYTTDELEFRLTKIVEGFLEDSEITYQQVIPSVYFTDEQNTEKLKYDLTEKMKEDSTFSSFVEDIKMNIVMVKFKISYYIRKILKLMKKPKKMNIKKNNLKFGIDIKNKLKNKKNLKELQLAIMKMI